MCVGIPIQVHYIGEDGIARGREADGCDYALPIQTALLDHLPQIDDWLLVHIDTAIRPLEADEARMIADALAAVHLAARGESFEHLLGGLIDREPQLPEHLREPQDQPGHTSSPAVALSLENENP